jgi:hypothetical protein
VNAHVHTPRRSPPLAGLAWIVDRAIPNPLLALPLLVLALGLLVEAPARITGDTWFGLAAGRDIVQHGLPHADRLMALTAGRSWQDQQWLAHLASYGLFDLGGLPLVYLVDAACPVAALLVAIAAARRLGGSPWPDTPGDAIAGAAARDPSLAIVSEAGYGDWLVWRYPQLRGRIAFDIRFELLAARRLTDVVHFEAAAGPTWNRPFAGYRLAALGQRRQPRGRARATRTAGCARARQQGRRLCSPARAVGTDRRHRGWGRPMRRDTGRAWP